MLLMENIELDVSVPVGPALHTLTSVSQLALPDEPKWFINGWDVWKPNLCTFLKLTRLMRWEEDEQRLSKSIRHLSN